jgi:hypothetical protein
MTSAEDFTILDLPKIAEIDVASPIACFKSMGLMKDVPEQDMDAVFARLRANDARATAAIWSTTGGVKTACLTDVTVIQANGDIIGVCDPEMLTHAPLTFCRTKYLKSGLDVMTLIAVNKASHVADICIYDPKRKAKEEDLYTIAGSVGTWLRALLGAGWGLRIEVFCDKYAPSEVPEMKDLWLILMIALKPYLPHVRMADTQAALRVECLAGHMDMRELLMRLFANIDALMVTA